MTLEGVKGHENIVSVWKKHYEKLLNSYSNDSKICKIDTESTNYSCTCESLLPYLCDKSMLKQLTFKLPLKKAAGTDGIMAEHLCFADQSLFHYLAVFVNLCLYHGIMPGKCMETIIIPVLKCSNGDVQSLNNYRPIAITSVISKLFENYVLSHVKNYLNTNDNQFGYKRKSGTDMCVFLLKQAVSSYVVHKSPVYSAFIDSSKAYD